MRLRAFTLAGIVCLSSSAARSAAVQLPLSADRFSLHGAVASGTTYAGKPALRLIESDASRASGLAVAKGTSLLDGTIEVDVAGRRGPYAQADDRGFVGVAFRVSGDASRFAYFYIRPENARVDDQLRRNHTTQYAVHPDFPWQVLRRDFPGVYESYTDLDPGGWTHLRVRFAGTAARLFVNGATEPALVVTDLKHPAAAGGVGLWIGAGTEAFFSNLRITP